MQITTRLLTKAQKIWNAYNQHPFILGIENGTLSKEKFRYYILQDYWYLKEYMKVFALGVAKAKKLKVINLFSKHLLAIRKELNVHKGYFKILHITREEITKVIPALDNLSYTSYMLRIAYEETEVEILTAIIACAYSYEVIAKKIIQNNPNIIHNQFYGDWVKNYSSKKYVKANLKLLKELNNLASDYQEQKIIHLEEIFINCSLYELAFWNMAWKNELINLNQINSGN